MPSPSGPPRRTKRLKRLPSFGGDKNYLIGIGFGLFALAIFGAIYLVSHKLQFLYACYSCCVRVHYNDEMIHLTIDALLSFYYMLHNNIIYVRQ